MMKGAEYFPLCVNCSYTAGLLQLLVKGISFLWHIDTGLSCRSPYQIARSGIIYGSCLLVLFM